MLLLSRRVGEKIYIGDDICLIVTNIQKGQVRIGIEAPASVPVHREEIYMRIKNEKQVTNNNNEENNDGHVTTD